MPRQRAPFTDPEIPGWDDDDVRRYLRFSSVGKTLVTGDIAMICVSLYPPTRYLVQDRRTYESISVTTLRAARRIAKLIEADWESKKGRYNG